MNGRFVALLALGLVLGLGLGVGITRLAVPVQYKDTAPYSLTDDGKDTYRELIAAGYAADHDLGRAQARLVLLGSRSAVQDLAAQAQRLVAQGGPYTQARQLAQLAADLNAQLATAAQPAAASPSEASPTAQPGFAPVKSTQVCDPTLGEPLLQVQARSASGAGQAGVRALVTWASGQDAFVTGLKNAQDPGYADFTMTPGVTYSLRLGESGQPVNGLAAVSCQKADGTGTYWGGWLVEFEPD